MDIIDTLLNKAAERVQNSKVRRTLYPLNIPIPVDLNRLYAALLRGTARYLKATRERPKERARGRTR